MSICCCLTQVHNAYLASVRIFLPYLTLFFFLKTDLQGPPTGLMEEGVRNTYMLPYIAQPVLS